MSIFHTDIDLIIQHCDDDPECTEFNHSIKCPVVSSLHCQFYLAIINKLENKAITILNIATESTLKPNLYEYELEHIDKVSANEYRFYKYYFLYLALKYNMKRLFSEMCKKFDYNNQDNYEYAEDVIKLSSLCAFLNGEVEILKQLMQFKTFDSIYLLTYSYYYEGHENGDESTVNHSLCLQALLKHINKCMKKMKKENRYDEIKIIIQAIAQAFAEQVDNSVILIQPFVPLLFIKYLPFILDKPSTNYNEVVGLKNDIDYILENIYDVIINDYEALIENYTRNELTLYLSQLKHALRILLQKGIIHAKDRIHFLCFIENIKNADTYNSISNYLKLDFVEREICNHFEVIQLPNKSNKTMQQIDDDLLNFINLNAKRRRLLKK